MVGTTGIEPVTPPMSRVCSPAELRARPMASHPDEPDGRNGRGIGEAAENCKRYERLSSAVMLLGSTQVADRISFYFDFISPFSYFAWQHLPKLAAAYGRELVFFPVDLAELKLLAGNTAPPTRMMPMKLKHLKEDQRRWAHHYGVPIATPAHYDSTLLNKGALFTIDHGCIEDYLTIVYRRVWGEGASMIDLQMIEESVSQCSLSFHEYMAFVKSDAAEARYRQHTLAAHEAGVFGVPTMITDGQMWWGNDRFHFMEAHLKG